MAQPLVIKKSPIVIVRNLILMQLAAVIFYAILAILADYGKLYHTLSISQVISYELAKFLIVSIVELILTFYIFLRWFNDSYELRTDRVVHEQGVLRSRQRSYQFKRPVQVMVLTSPLGRLLKYGSLELRPTGGELVAVLRDISQPERLVELIETGREQRRSEAEFEAAPDITTLIKQAEDERLEKKSSFRWDFHSQKVNIELEQAVMKTLAAFLNSEGGQMVIGVDDRGGLVGLTPDYRTLRRPDADGFENHLTQVFNRLIGADSRRLIRITFPRLGETELCLIRVVRSPKPVYVKGQNEEIFYVRTGNTTTPLTVSQATAYIQSWWRQ